jgi:TonB family protein
MRIVNPIRFLRAKIAMAIVCATLFAFVPDWARAQTDAEESPTPVKAIELSALMEEVSGKLNAALEGWRNARGQARRARVLVLDFRTWDERWLPFGGWLADNFSAAFSSYGGTFDVIDRRELFGVLKAKHLVPEEEIDIKHAADIAESLKADILIGAMYSVQGNELGFWVRARPAGPVKLGQRLFSNQSKIVMSPEIADHMGVPLEVIGPRKGENLAGWNGVTIPKCLSCPSPPRSPEWKKKRPYGTSVLVFVVNPDGSVSDVQVARPLDPTLDQQAVDTVKSWKMEPAKDQNGIPVDVRNVAEMNYQP